MRSLASGSRTSDIKLRAVTSWTTGSPTDDSEMSTATGCFTGEGTG